MKKRMRLLSVFMLVAMLVAMVPARADAATKKPGKPKISSVSISLQTVTVKYNKVKNAKTYKLYSVTNTSKWKYVKTIKASQKKKYSDTSKYKLKKSGKKYKLYKKKRVTSYKQLATSKKTSISFKGNWDTTYKLVVRAYNGKKAGSYSSAKTAKIGSAPTPDYDSYETYVFFGSDSRVNDESWKSPDGGKNTADQTGTNGTPRSDVIMLLQVNRQNRTIDMVSVYRDTAMDRSASGDPNFQKANKAYAQDGPLAAIAVLEKNLDIKIKGYAASNFKGVADMIDDLCRLTDSKGLKVSGLTTENVQSYKDNGQNDVIDTVNSCVSEMNNCYGTSVPAITDHTKDTQELCGLQCVGYARTRSTEGWEMRRTGRQREVLQEMIKKYNELNATEKIDLIISNASGIDSNIKLKELAELISAVSEFTINPSAYPYFKGQVTKVTDEEYKNESTMIVPVSIVDNVTKLHASTYDESWYVPSSAISALSSKLEAEIKQKTDIYYDYTGKMTGWEKY